MKSFFQKDLDALLVVAIVLLAGVVLFQNIDRILGTDDETPSAFTKVQRKVYNEKKQYYAVPKRERELFPFDPNTADSSQLLRLGLTPWQVRSIYRYRAAGGTYRKPTDFARLYGLTAEEYRRLRPYIRIKPVAMAADVYAEKDTLRYEKSTSSASIPKNMGWEPKLKAGETVDLNTADTTLLKRVPGIGSYYAGRIARKREQLGGLHSASQLLEIEGFPEEALPYFSVSGNVRKININKLSARELSRHPYLRYVQAKQIEEYRQRVHPFKSVDELANIPSITPQDIKRLTPYIDL